MEILKYEILRRPCCIIEFIESFLFWVILVTYNIGIYIYIYIYKVSCVQSFFFFFFFFVIFNCNVSYALHAKHFEIWKKILWSWWVDCFVAQSSSDVIFLCVHSESIFFFVEYFLLKKTVFPLVSLSLAQHWVNQPRYFW